MKAFSRLLLLYVSSCLQLLAQTTVSPSIAYRANVSEGEIPPTLSPENLFEKLSPSVFTVEALDSSGEVFASGSGVAVASATDTPAAWTLVSTNEIVTNLHVIEAAATLRVKRGETTWPAVVTHVDDEHDLCRLRVEGLQVPPVPVRLSPALAVGERVYAIGQPENLELSLSDGLISGLRERDGIRKIQTTAAISDGSSGGGLFDTQGRLIGITASAFEGTAQNLNFAVPVEYVLTLDTHPVQEGTGASGEGRGLVSHVRSWFDSIGGIRGVGEGVIAFIQAIPLLAGGIAVVALFIAPSVGAVLLVNWLAARRRRLAVIGITVLSAALMAGFFYFSVSTGSANSTDSEVGFLLGSGIILAGFLASLCGLASLTLDLAHGIIARLKTLVDPLSGTRPWTKAWWLVAILPLALLLLWSPNQIGSGISASAVQPQSQRTEVTVWVNTASGVYHCSGSQWYGRTKRGQYMSECKALEAGHRPAYGNPCGSTCR